MIDSALLAENRFNIGVQTHIILKRGWVLSEIKEYKVYKDEADSFEEYLAQDDVRKDARICMDLYGFYITKHRLHHEDIQDIHYLRLLEAIKAIKLHPENLEEWLEKCRVLSWKDLINEIREARGKPQMPVQKATSSPGSSCIICGGLPVEDAHWPITKKMGGTLTLPLCNKCHIGDLHQHGDIEFYTKYKRKIGKWLATQQAAGR